MAIRATYVDTVHWQYKSIGSLSTGLCTGELPQNQIATMYHLLAQVGCVRVKVHTQASLQKLQCDRGII